MPRLAETTGAMAQANRLHSGKMPEGRHFGVRARPKVNSPSICGLVCLAIWSNQLKYHLVAFGRAVGYER